LDFNNLPIKSVSSYLNKKGFEMSLSNNEYQFRKDGNFYFTYDNTLNMSSVNHELVEEISKLFTIRASDSKILISTHFANLIQKPVIDITSFFLII
jgi:hypothetical protein